MSVPKISIITPSYAQGHFLEETINSVLGQRYPELEYIVIDGGSKDESVSIIRKYEERLAYWVSEPDRGQVHAINKGLEKATGDLVAFINSDDVYLPGAFSSVAQFFEQNKSCNWLCGDTILFGHEGQPTQLIQANVPKTAAHCLSWAYTAPQPGMFWRRELLRSGFQERWRYCFDHDLYVRLLLEGHSCEHLPTPVAAYRLHKASKTVADSPEFDKEFDSIVEVYEEQLRGSGKRWCAATRLLRLSYSASTTGKRSEALGYLFRAFIKHPEGVRHRPFWGCLRRLVLPGAY